MDVTTSADTPAVARVLVVADWAVDPHGIVAACHRRAAEDEARFAVVVPAWLHGLDWAGDPHASRPCAARQLEALTRLAGAAGLTFERSEVGDPDPMSANRRLRRRLRGDGDPPLHETTAARPPLRPRAPGAPRER